MTLSYLYSRFFKKVLRGSSILNSHVDKRAKIYSGTEFYDSSIDRYSYIGYDGEVHNCDIGAFCSIANRFIAGGAKHPIDWVSTSPVFYNAKGGTGLHLGHLEIPPAKRTYIGHDVWIGARVIVMQGIQIGNGAIIGAGSVVTKDIPPYAIAVGCPAKVIKYRFDEKTIAELQETEWWKLPDEQLLGLSKKISHPKSFCKALNNPKIGGGKSWIAIYILACHDDVLRHSARRSFEIERMAA